MEKVCKVKIENGFYTFKLGKLLADNNISINKLMKDTNVKKDCFAYSDSEQNCKCLKELYCEFENCNFSNANLSPHLGSFNCFIIIFVHNTPHFFNLL